MTDAITNYGVTFGIGDGEVSEAFTVIGEVTTLDPPELMQEAVEATNHSSGGWREFIKSGLKELSEFKCTINYIPADSDALVAIALAGTKHNFKITFPNGDVWAFNALITKFKPSGSDAKSSNTLTAEVTFRPSGTSTIG